LLKAISEQNGRKKVEVTACDRGWRVSAFLAHARSKTCESHTIVGTFSTVYPASEQPSVALYTHRRHQTYICPAQRVRRRYRLISKILLRPKMCSPTSIHTDTVSLSLCLGSDLSCNCTSAFKLWMPLQFIKVATRYSTSYSAAAENQILACNAANFQEPRGVQVEFVVCSTGVWRQPRRKPLEIQLRASRFAERLRFHGMCQEVLAAWRGIQRAIFG
jgi:hypothetical protein